MQIVNVHDAKTHFSKYLGDVAKGKEILIGNRGKAVAKLVPLAPPKKASRKPGTLSADIWIAKDFDEPVAEWEAALEDSIDENTG